MLAEPLADERIEQGDEESGERASFQMLDLPVSPGAFARHAFRRRAAIVDSSEKRVDYQLKLSAPSQEPVSPAFE